ncbi:hypothetical protein N7530_001926, partial [Penicillium desertorum]
VATLIAGVFVLDYGADKFIDHTVVVGRRLGVSQTVIALLTAGAEWEEPPSPWERHGFDYLQHSRRLFFGATLSSPGSGRKIILALLFLVATLFVALAFFNQLNQIVGGVLIAIFALYVVSLIYAIYKGVASPSELSDSDSNGEYSNSDDGEYVNHATISENPPLIENEHTPQRKQTKQKPYHIFQLILGFISLSLSGYILSHSAVTIADSLHFSGTVFGLTVVSFATTLPEKLVAILSGSRGHGNIMAATTAGSNIFLLTLCVGVVAVAGYQVQEADNFVLFELVAVWMSSLLFCAVIFLGMGNAGVVLLAAYLGFLCLEFTGGDWHKLFSILQRISTQCMKVRPA